ncbi:hypothetical protein BL250_03520 [Erwinia sp. OLTSP20]|uniref:FlxA-like family protein n=1 Tax=unclassified Erwinia TaxID=2622719 RepID=UPI000C1872C4|nr:MULTISPECIES: FlxA-like family protein [unclassified Erwinia]PIJ51546.1 hypothetical protein BV501_03725 [Erwinia sp. OAMSP11]PIJ75868.1 hypothetical protein BK416_00530 [Erwinia sp. OLSSP12]PIJ83456.1 hypothetical protein BLD47_04720 [Erwinia sp. OLCASP19]PIJ86289.1 hypothetical protein BLD46_04150 [Erwinia sp. OLMTSP26]PIJ88468.1 hypothetical protein BLD49_01720 [Erwinia sp. OLMDSP33]
MSSIGSIGSASHHTDSNPSSKIAAIYKQIAQLAQQLSELATCGDNSEITNEESAMIESEIKMLETLIAQLLARQNQPDPLRASGSMVAAADGINRPTGNHQLDVYT